MLILTTNTDWTYRGSLTVEILVPGDVRSDLVDGHFSVTAHTYDSAGCQHELILKHFPELKSLIALHLSDKDGIPLHAVENGFYWLAGAKEGHFEQRFHGGQTNSKEECVQILANHLRTDLDVAFALVDTISTKEQFAQYVEGCKPRWAREAKAALEKVERLAKKYA